MGRRRTEALTWANNASLSNWVWFGADAPVGLVVPASMAGAQLAFVGTESGTDGNADAAQAQDLLNARGERVVITLPAAGGRIVLGDYFLRSQGWIALRSETAAGVAQVQGGTVTARWLGVAD